MLDNSEDGATDQTFAHLKKRHSGQDKKLFDLGHLGSYRSHDESAFHSTKNCENFETGKIWFKNFLRKFPENPKLLNFWKVNCHSPENPEKFQEEVQENGNRLPVRNNSKFW